MFGRGAAAWRGSSASSNFRVWMVNGGSRTVSLEVLLAGSDELDGDELVAGGEQSVSRVSMFGRESQWTQWTPGGKLTRAARIAG